MGSVEGVNLKELAVENSNFTQGKILWEPRGMHVEINYVRFSHCKFCELIKCTVHAQY